MSEGRADALHAGSRLQVYRVEDVLGAGGFGITYRAVEDITDRRVAIKEFLPSAVAQRAPDGISVRPLSRGGAIDFSWGLDRFRLEARTLIALQHPNIVPVLTYFEANGTGYLVMEYQSGRTLGSLIRPDKRLSQFELEEILFPLLDALEAVHAKGFLHRDVKPDNIFIRSDGKPLLLDFGAARQAVGAKSQSLTAIVSEGYAPYEQYESDSVPGPWTDIYALGATLYRCMTGKRPAAAPKRVNARMSKEPDPVIALRQTVGADYDPRLVAAVEAAICTVAAERPQSIAALRAMLAAPGTHGAANAAPGAVTDRRRGRASPIARLLGDRRARIAAGVAVVLAGAIYLGMQWDEGRRFERLIATAETQIVKRDFAQAERNLDDAARLRPDAAVIRLLRTRLVEEKRIDAGERNTPQLVLKNRDCAECPELVEIPAGRFVMGSPAGEYGHYPQESPQHEVAIARPFLMGKYEITVGQFRVFLDRSGHKPVAGCATFDPDGGTYRHDPYAAWSNPDFPVSDNHPVVCVSWRDASAYVAWLTRETRKTYRLPSEAEWEYAARAGESGANPWVGAEQAACVHANAADMTTRGRLPNNWNRVACDDRHAFTAPVGRFKPNAFGVHDMLGNAWEWVEDCFKRGYDGAPADGSAWQSGDCSERVMRGGGWISQVRDVRLANRGHNLPERGYYSAGFRVVRAK